jgi:hypothetical protein
MNNVEKLSIIWIKRISDFEDNYLQKNFNIINKNYNVEKIVVGHTKLDPDEYNFKYIPFWEYELDKMSLLGLKKNLGVYNATKLYSLVLHVDTYPSNKLLDNVDKKNLSDLDVVAPIGFLECPCGENKKHRRGYTWMDLSDIGTENFDKWRYMNLLADCDKRHKLPEEPPSETTYISGAAIFSKTSTFRKIGWNNGLRHGEYEDVEYSQRLIKNGYKLSCDTDLEVYMLNRM